MKHIKLKISKLEDRLKLISKVIPSSPILDELGSYLLNGKNSILSISGTDLECYIIGKMPYAGPDFNLLIPSIILNKLTSNSKGNLKIEIDIKVVTLITSEYSLSIPIIDPNNYPDKPENEEKIASFEITSAFISSFKKACSFTSNDVTNIKLTGVKLEVDNNVKIVASNSYEAFIQNINIRTEGSIEVLISPILRKFIVKGETFLNKKNLEISSNKFNIFVSNIESNFPDYEKAFFFNDSVFSLITNKQDFIKACQNLIIISKSDLLSVKFIINDNLLSMEAKDYDTEIAAYSNIKCNCIGIPFPFTVRIKSLLRILKSLNTNSIEFVFSGKSKPIKIINENGFRFIMPIINELE